MNMPKLKFQSKVLSNNFFLFLSEICLVMEWQSENKFIKILCPKSGRDHYVTRHPFEGLQGQVQGLKDNSGNQKVSLF